MTAEVRLCPRALKVWRKELGSLVLWNAVVIWDSTMPTSDTVDEMRTVMRTTGSVSLPLGAADRAAQQTLFLKPLCRREQLLT